MASLVIFMQLRYLFHEVQRRIRRHKNYLRVVGNMEARWAPSLLCNLDVDLVERILRKKLGFFYVPLIHSGMVWAGQMQFYKPDP